MEIRKGRHGERVIGDKDIGRREEQQIRG